MDAISPKVIFQTLRKYQLSQDDLEKDIKQIEVDGVTVVIDGNLKIFEVNIEKVKGEKDLEKRIVKAINTAIETMQKQHFETLQNITIS